LAHIFPARVYRQKGKKPIRLKWAGFLDLSISGRENGSLDCFFLGDPGFFLSLYGLKA
jgi:hypothetical protein